MELDPDCLTAIPEEATRLFKRLEIDFSCWKIRIVLRCPGYAADLNNRSPTHIEISCIGTNETS